MKTFNRVAVIGLDGANNVTAKLAGLSDQHLYTLLSTIPPYTPPAWTSMITGVNPAKHGIIGWQKVNAIDLSVKLFNSHDVKYPRVNEILDLHGLKSIMINLPLMYPFTGVSRKKNSIIVSDWASPKQEIYPKELGNKYREFLIDPPHRLEKFEHRKREYISLLEEFLEKRIQMYYDLIENYEWNLFFIVFSEVDWISHLFPQVLEGKDIHLVISVFNRIKKFIKTASDLSDITLIVSDHGFEIKRKILYVNQILKNGGYIRYGKASAVLKSLRRIIPKKFRRKIARTLHTQASVIGIMKYGSNPENFKAFMIEPSTWGVYVRDRNVMHDLVKYLSKSTYISDVVLSEHIYSGEHLDKLPQIFLVPEKGVKFSHELKGIEVKDTYKGDHEMHGVLGVLGTSASKEIQFTSQPKVWDIAPTILYALGVPVPDDVDGRVLLEIFEEKRDIVRMRRPKLVNMDKVIKKLKSGKMRHDQ